MISNQMTAYCAADSTPLACHAVSGERRTVRALLVSCRTVLVLVMAQMCFSGLAQAETPGMIGTWNLEITFANERHHSVRFDAKEGGKGSLQLTDPAARVWGPGKSSEAKWSRDEGNSVTFSGPVEFLLGNVGREAGILTCKGKFESANSISGEVDFFLSVEDRPPKHGTFKAVRNGK